MDKSGDDRAVTIELPPGTETITPSTANLIADLTSPGLITIDGHNRVLKLDDPGAFTVGEGVTLTLRNITLMGNNNNTSPLIEVQARGKLVLEAGVTLTGNKTTYGVSGGVWVNGGELVMNDGAVIKRMEILSDYYFSSDVKAGGVLISNHGRFIMYGGTIGGEDSDDGNIISFSGYNNISSGGVCVLNGSFDMYNGIIQSNRNFGSGGGGVAVYTGIVFTMYGGAIKENKVMSGGGGVYNGGTFIMADGIIKENIVESMESSSSGGGVYNSGTFIMNGMDIVIEGNTVNSEIYVGGGVCNAGTFIMNAGTIKRNRTLLTLPNYSAKGMAGGGVYNHNGTFTMNGGTIGGNPGDANTAANGANGVYASRFTMSGGIITGNTAVGTNNYGVLSGDFTMMGPAQVTQDNPVLLSGAVTIGGDLDNSPAANIIYSNPNSIPASGTKLLKASSSALITENYHKFLYNGVPNLINSNPINEGAVWYGVYK
jgi:hypothetical protein